MPWPGVPLWVVVILLTWGREPLGVRAEGNVGCLFSDRLCLEDEWCFDDLAFGRCLPPAGDVDEDDLFRYDLEREALHQISRELRRLFALGYRWSHGYTQCRLQAMLYATKHDISFENNACSHLVDQDLEGALKALEDQDPLDPKEMAIVKYTPSVEDPHAQFADEVYYPPIDETVEQARREKILGSDAIDVYDIADPYANLVKRTWIPQMHRRSLPSESYFPLNSRRVEEIPSRIEELYPLVEELSKIKVTPEEIKDALGEEDFEKLTNLVEDMEKERDREEEEEEEEDPFERFTLTYNTPDNFRAGWESRDTLDEFPESRIYNEEDEEEQEEYGSGHRIPEGIFRELKNRDSGEVFRELKHREKGSNPGVYTEGGVVYAKNDDLGELLGFKRPERLDVKKPGPPFDSQIGDGNKRALPNRHQKFHSTYALPYDTFPQDHYVVDTAYVYVEFENNVYKWAEGKQLIGNISKLLGLEPTSFSHGRVDHNEVTFKVEPNNKGWNSTQVAEQIGLIKEKLKERTGIVITAAGIGDKTKMRTVVSAQMTNADFYIVIFTICGVLGATIIAATVLLVIRRHLHTRDKLNGLSTDTEASKDYQDLCRARMAAKQPHPGQSGDAVHGRITSLSRESEQSPSSRSSTSSWSEEPALHNMDISTGHMVLSYMEDHLKNKDRLEQEWVALCAYVAEPCEISIGTSKKNTEKNRYKEVVPYDHARVVLNELSNVTGEDYINASTITDHDPRNPAYIATQGPLPHTAPDFWQLIWEQGAVVIVMLTRLTEGGAAMCHRYWPEEGSELYHTYEVHLVSEHIWCDDYMGRSFYLKNLRTGETRTVTQFHFLSWPENGVPSSTKALLEFRRKVNKSYRGRSCPIVVHCSDGAGRTGTYCLIDMVLSRMAKGAKEIDIAATLEHLRDQRPRMVATKQQFEFVLTAVAEEVHAILKALPPQQGDKEKQ